jgi:ABC-type ATPase with predicted acetyltransferase domain
MGTMIIADDGGITNYYTQAYVDDLKVKLDAYEKSDFFKEAYVEQLKDEVAEYKSLYEDQYRKCSELQAKDLNKKYAEAIAKDYLNKNTELLENIMTMYDRLKEAMLVRDISFGSEPAEEDVEIVTWWQVAKQFKELFNIGDYKDE